MYLGYKFRIYPNKTQSAKLRQMQGCCRWLWNHWVALNANQYEKDKTFVWYSQMCQSLPELKKQQSWLGECHSQVLQQTLKSLDTALKSCGRKQANKKGFPRFRSKNHDTTGLCFPQGTRIQDGQIYLPKIGWVAIRQHRAIPNTWTSASVTCDAGDWYVSLLVQVPEAEPVLIDRNRVIGVDLGLTDFAVTSEGQKFPGPKFARRAHRRVRRRQQQLSRKQRGSKNRKKAQKKLARAHAHVRHQRLDWLHKLSRHFVDQFDLICAEDLKTKDLITKPTSTRALRRSIADAGWGMFLTQLRYKCQLSGKHFVQIGQYQPSSKTCHRCGHKTDSLTLDQRAWTCAGCGAVLDRDVNAALMIAFWGQTLVDVSKFINTAGTAEIQACGERPSFSAKQEATAL